MKRITAGIILYFGEINTAIPLGNNFILSSTTINTDYLKLVPLILENTLQTKTFSFFFILQVSR